MKTHKQAYIAVDLHSNHSMIGYMNENGEYIDQQQVQTSDQNLINQVVAIPADYKQLVVEQSNMAFYVAEQLRPYVDRLVVCDPRQNHLISGSSNKNDHLDTLRLCKLLRLDELKPVWAPKQMGKRRLFYGQVKTYQKLTKTLTKYKNRLQANLRHWGFNIKLTSTDYKHPQTIISQIEEAIISQEVAAGLRFIAFTAKQKADQMKRVTQTGNPFWEISEFQKMAGIGPVGSHTFSAYIQTPYRFQTRAQLIRFCQLAVCKYSSDGQKLKNEHLDKAGHGCLKNIAHTAWSNTVGYDNEVNGFFQASLQRTKDETNARLNTQRKILTTLWSIWKHKRTYRPEKFFSGSGGSLR
jgi:transposase